MNNLKEFAYNYIKEMYKEPRHFTEFDLVDVFCDGFAYANNWISGDNPPKECDFPNDKKGLQCLIVRKNYNIPEIAYYDFYYSSWNDSENDDHLCNNDQVEKWKVII